MKNKRLCCTEEHGDREGEKTQENCVCASSMLYSEDDRCLICFDCLLEREVGFLENCHHIFCLSCILKWAKTVSSCPVDRKPFQAVYKFGALQECVKIQIKRETIGKENCSSNKAIKQTSCFHTANKCCTRSNACKGPSRKPFCKTFKEQHRALMHTNRRCFQYGLESAAHHSTYSSYLVKRQEHSSH